MAFGFDPSTALRTRHPSVAGANSDSARRNLPVHLSLSSCRVSEIVLKQGYHGVPLITWLSHAFSLERRKTTWMPGIKDRGSTTPSLEGPQWNWPNIQVFCFPRTCTESFTWEARVSRIKVFRRPNLRLVNSLVSRHRPWHRGLQCSELGEESESWAFQYGTTMHIL